MECSLGRRLLPAVLLVSLVVGDASAGDLCHCKRSMGCGYGPGYNAPVPPVGTGWHRGCCEIPASWRLHVWDGYRGDPWTYQRSMVGAYPDNVHMPSAQVFYGQGAAGGMGYGNGGACANCAGGGSMMGPSLMPSATPTAAPAYSQTSMPTSVIRAAMPAQR